MFDLIASEGRHLAFARIFSPTRYTNGASMFFVSMFLFISLWALTLIPFFS